MPTPQLQVGYPQTMVVGTVYALPASRCLFFAGGTGTFTQSSDAAFTVPVALTLTSGQAEVSGAFIKCAVADTVVTVKKL